MIASSNADDTPGRSEANAPKDTGGDSSARRFDLREIRSLGQKPGYRVIGNWLARRWARPAAVYGTWLALRFGIPAHWVTAAAAVSWLGEAFCLAAGTSDFFVAAVILGYLGFWLDHVDGQVARVSGTVSLEGVFLDFWVHTAHATVRGIGLGWGAYVLTGQPLAIVGGIAASFGWTMMRNVDDARYKALFAELEKRRDRRESLRLRPEDEATGPSQSPPRSACLARFRWLAAKMSEPHAVLIAMTAIALILMADGILGRAVWCAALAWWALTAPLVAVGRLVRVIRSQAVTSSFDSWFESGNPSGVK